MINLRQEVLEIIVKKPINQTILKGLAEFTILESAWTAHIEPILCYQEVIEEVHVILSLLRLVSDESQI